MAWLAQYMESHDMDIDLRDHCGHTPLHLAARAGHASAVAILVAHGADVTAKVRAEQSYSILVGCPPPAPAPASSQPQTWCAVSSKSIDSHQWCVGLLLVHIWNFPIERRPAAAVQLAKAIAGQKMMLMISLNF